MEPTRGTTWDGRVHNMWKAKHAEMAQEPSREDRATVSELQDVWETRLDMEEDASDSEVGDVQSGDQSAALL